MLHVVYMQSQEVLIRIWDRILLGLELLSENHKCEAFMIIMRHDQFIVGKTVCQPKQTSFRVESKILEDDISAPSWTSSEEGSLDIEWYNDTDPVSFRAHTAQQFVVEQLSPNLSDDWIENGQDNSSDSFTTISSNLDDIVTRCDTKNFRFNGYLMKKFNDLDTFGI